MQDDIRPQILLIDHHPEELRFLLEAVRQKGHRVSLAFDPMQGYRRATAVLPDLVLLDARMGPPDGFAICRLLKADCATMHIPVIFVTASASIEDRLTGLRCGAVDYILKPFEPLEVMARIAIHLAPARTGRATHDVHDADPGTAPETRNRDHAVVQAAVRLIRSDLVNVPPLAQIASRVGTHEKRLSRAFRELMGHSVFDFVRRARLQEAQRLLADSALSVEEVATSVGFLSAANFSTAFRARFGHTPSAFRSARRARPEPGPGSATLSVEET